MLAESHSKQSDSAVTQIKIVIPSVVKLLPNRNRHSLVFDQLHMSFCRSDWDSCGSLSGMDPMHVHIMRRQMHGQSAARGLSRYGNVFKFGKPQRAFGFAAAK